MASCIAFEIIGFSFELSVSYCNDYTFVLLDEYKNMKTFTPNPSLSGRGKNKRGQRTPFG
jgi:hypothetical protein